ncbi:MAG: DUF547 domain-containing protein, partial [Betaproteobacteria bacterium]
MKRLLVLLMLMLPMTAAFAQFDQSYAAWSALLKKHVVVLGEGRTSQVRYADFAKDRPALKAFLDGVSNVTESEFNSWTKTQQMAFLINAYNAFTIEKILTRYPELKSIRDFGTVFGNPWKDKFFTLFGKES